MLADLDVVAVGDQQARALRDGVLQHLGAVVGGDDDLAGLVGLLDLDPAGGLGDRRAPLGDARLEDLLDHAGRPCVMSSAEATPPVWNVRIVSWVPGSPIDWAAMMPTASPMSTSLPVASERP